MKWTYGKHNIDYRFKSTVQSDKKPIQFDIFPSNTNLLVVEDKYVPVIR